MKEKSTEYKAGSTIVEDGIYFEVPSFFGRKAKLNIKPLKPGTIVRIGMLCEEMNTVDEKENMIVSLLSNGRNIEIIASAIAYAVINEEFFQKWKYRYYKWLLLKRVQNLEHLSGYWNIVLRQSSAQHFFFIMASTPAMNFLKKKEEGKKVEKHSGEHLD